MPFVHQQQQQQQQQQHQSLNELADDDIIALPFDGYIASINNDDEPTNNALQQQQLRPSSH